MFLKHNICQINGKDSLKKSSSLTVCKESSNLLGKEILLGKEQSYVALPESESLENKNISNSILVSFIKIQSAI